MLVCYAWEEVCWLYAPGGFERSTVGIRVDVEPQEGTATVPSALCSEIGSSSKRDNSLTSIT